MGRGNGLKLKCTCGACKLCRDRTRKRNIKNGTHKPYVPQGRKRDNASRARREAR